jgi:hypothetical protein
MMRNFPKIFLRAWRAFEFSHGLPEAVSPNSDQVFRSGGCESGGGVPLRASKADETKPDDP